MSKDEPKVPPKVEKPSFQQVKEEIGRLPKAKSFFSYAIKMFSKNDLLRIISWQAVTSQQMQQQLEGRIKELEDDNEQRLSAQSAKKTKPVKAKK